MNQYIFPYPESFTVTAGVPRVIDMRNRIMPVTLTAIPGASGSLLIEISTTPNALEAPGSATWVNWPHDTVTSVTQDALLAPISALRFTATTSNGTVEVVR